MTAFNLFSEFWMRNKDLGTHSGDKRIDLWLKMWMKKSIQQARKILHLKYIIFNTFIFFQIIYVH